MVSADLGNGLVFVSQCDAFTIFIAMRFLKSNWEK